MGLGKILRNLALVGLISNIGVNGFFGIVDAQISNTSFYRALNAEENIKLLRGYRASFGVQDDQIYTDSLNVLINRADSLSAFAERKSKLVKKSIGRMFFYEYFTD